MQGGDQWSEACKMRQVAYNGRGCHASCVHTHLHLIYITYASLFLFLAAFFCFYCRRLILPLFKRDVFVRNGYFSPTRSISIESHFCKPKLAKMLLILIKQNLRYTLYFSMKPYFEKTLCTQRRKSGMSFFIILFNKLFNFDICGVCLILL